MNTIAEIAHVLKNLKSAVIFSHSRPDGDAIGSAMALSYAFARLGIRCEVVNESELPASFRCLKGTERILRFPTLDAEAYVCVDSSDENRFGELQKTFLRGARRGKITVNIDHHVSNTRYCKYNYVRECSSNCENMAAVISAMGVPLDGDIASCLMAGLITDSGCFSHDDVNGNTFRIAASLTDAGANVKELTYRLFQEQTKARAQMYAYVISNLRFFLSDRLSVAVVSRRLLEGYGLKQDATSGIVDFGLTIDTVEVSVCLMEVKAGQYKVSFRSKGRVDVNAVAGRFGGGGHIAASGCMLFGDVEEVLDKIRYAVSQHMEEV